MAELGHQTVEFSTLVSRAAEDSFFSLKDLVEKSKSSEQTDTEKKVGLLKFLVKTQQRMLRLNVLAKWCQQVPLIQYCQQLASTLSSHDSCFTQAADSLFFMHEGLQQARAPVYDVPSAIEVLLSKTYQRLPKCIEDVGLQSMLSENQQKPALKKLDMLVRSTLLELSLPKEISEVKVSNGTALLCVDGEFTVLITLGYRGHLSLWRILHLELLVGERSGPVKMEESQRHALGDDLERRMAVMENPFMILYSVLHELCVALIMDTVLRQVQVLRQGRWKDAIRFELISDSAGEQASKTAYTQANQDGEVEWAGLRTPGLKILYWLDLDRISGFSESGSCPFIKIEPGPDLQIRCLHSSFVVDPITGKEAEFALDQACIDVEELLLKAICCNRYTRLLEIQKQLHKNSQLSRGAADVVLQCQMDEPDLGYKEKGYKTINREYNGLEVLRVRAYGSSFITLGINIRNGRYRLQSSKNIITPAALSECEEGLNQGSMTAADAFVSLRSKSLLHLFASLGRFFGLEVYEDGSGAIKVPKNMLISPSLLVMGFPDCEGSFFLLVQLDQEFKPLFKLLETQPDPSRKSRTYGVKINVVGIKEIDIGKIQMLQDDLDLSLLDMGKLLAFSPKSRAANQKSGSGLAEFGIETPMQITQCRSSSFSSIVDEVFALEKGTSEPPSVLNSTSKTSNLGPVTANSSYIKAKNPSPMLDGGIQISQMTNASRFSCSDALVSSATQSSSNMKGTMPSHSAKFLSLYPGRSTGRRKLPASKSDQDLASLTLSHADTLGGSLIDPRTSTMGPLAGSSKVSGSRMQVITSKLQTLDFAIDQESTYGNPRKRSISDILKLIPSLPGQEISAGLNKRQKLSNSSQQHPPEEMISSNMLSKSEAYGYENLITEAHRGNAPSSIYISALLHVLRYSTHCIKHARLTSQMEALDIPYVEEVGLRNPSSNLWFRVPFATGDSWPHICLRLGRPESMSWDVKITDQHFKDLWELKKGSSNTPWGSRVLIANTSDMDSHIRHDAEGVVLSYNSVEADSIKKLVADIQRLFNARMFALGMRKKLWVSEDERQGANLNYEAANRLAEQTRRGFRIEAVGLVTLWFSFGSAVLARFVVDWESGREGCTMHVSPDQLWPHTKFLEDFINGGEVSSLLDCIRLTTGPLHALAAATRPARAGSSTGATVVGGATSSISRQNVHTQAQVLLAGNLTSNSAQPSSNIVGNQGPPTSLGALGNHSLHAAAVLSASSRGGPGLVPSSLLPIDVSVVLRGPYWIRIIYRKNFAVDMRCFAGDQVWLQPATPPKGGPSVGGSIPCPQFRPFIMEHVAQELNVLEPNFSGSQQLGGLLNSNNGNLGASSQLTATNGIRVNVSSSNGISRPGIQAGGLNRGPNAAAGPSNLGVANSGMPMRRSPGTGIPGLVKGELNTAIIGLGDDGGYGGGWVPLVALKKVLRGILKYLGVLWLFAQLPDLLKEILGSILIENEGSLLNLDQEQPALRFFVGGYVFAVSVHRVQLLLQVLSVKRFHQQQQQQNSASAQEELSQSEISEICDYFSRRVASEPYDASRVASFITLLTLPISVLREFLRLIAWKKGLIQAQSGDVTPAQKPRIELCLENHAGVYVDGDHENSCTPKSNIHYNRPHNSVDFGLTIVLDPSLIPHMNAAGGAAWLPYCVSVRLRYFFGDNPNVSFLSMEGSHGGRACWLKSDDWERCKQRVCQTVESSGSTTDVVQGRLRSVAENAQKTLHLCLRGLRDGSRATASSGAT